MQFYYQPKQHYIDEENDDRPAIWVERIWNHKGSTSGASSGDFHAYRRMKRAEAIKKTEQEEEENEVREHEEFQQQRNERIEKYTTQSQKKRERRLKKIQKQKENAQKKKGLKRIEREAQLHNKFKNDGSFLAALTDGKVEDQEQQNKLEEIPEQEESNESQNESQQ